MTLTHLLRAADTMEQFRLLAIADRFSDRCGRYYAGPLTPEDLVALAPPPHSVQKST